MEGDVGACTLSRSEKRALKGLVWESLKKTAQSC